jgi:hypothetical protein
MWQTRMAYTVENRRHTMEQKINQPTEPTLIPIYREDSWEIKGYTKESVHEVLEYLLRLNERPISDFDINRKTIGYLRNVLNYK